MSTISSFPLYAQKWYMSYRFCWFHLDPARKLSAKPVWHVPFLCVPWKTPDVEHGNCPKHVEFYSKNKFEKLVHLVSFIIRILTIFFEYYLTQWGAILDKCGWTWVNLKHERQRNVVVFYSQGLYFLANFSLLSAVLRTADGMNLLAFGCV